MNDASKSQPSEALTIEAYRGEQSEDQFALVFEELYRHKLRYCHTSGTWYVWDGNCWRRDDIHLVLDNARKVCRACANGKPTYLRHATVNAVERLARSARALAVTAECWDTDPWLLGTPGGTVNLRTGELRHSSQGDFITRQTRVMPATQDVVPSLWLNFLNEATGNDPDLIRYLQQIAGYCLTGCTDEHVLFFVSGPGGNGKTVFTNTLTGIQGEYAQPAAMETFTASKHDKHSTDLAALKGARLVTASETEEGRHWAEAKIKQMTGGDPITARFMRCDNFTYHPEFKLVISGNHKPSLDNVDDAMRRRLHIIPFTNKPSTPDPDLESKLRVEWPAILRWMIDGCLDWQQNGFQRPNVVSDATSSYFEDQDLLGQWLDEFCEQGANYEDSHKILYTSWSNYAKDAGEEPRKEKAFTQMLVNRGFERKKSSKARGFRGLRIKPAPVTDDPRFPDAWSE
ncbi:phage/plasmid primase, P4 family [Pseudomonas sp. P1.8]|uniref:phage/plasmid primase, P4 family n=1 Tax=Pseudomonas sp. P1.8 TaxID=1699310 RepID=UPI00069F5C34|nr:phage/plasmid primase, P4 family [Pseudomonas sp. P1.8]